ncbi:glycosyltransferase family 25 protein [Alteromonas sp. ASW11-36]|uniref:Glycosyltransferase family 25 protein n=1 Tax=Alteromonas arenosi TaxID=3055817 RepID=A0ABT7SSW3_9ALTE|nr:glycosyltransferase family 25 protein [Alteromonas sp. ASW11-36]MDM7859283.1 glycosyltransferase family 25 protein [Alteromonas sp. ASW11-36]
MSNHTCLVINLARSPERMALMNQQLEALAIPFERIDAVDGQQLSEVQVGEVYDGEHLDAYYKKLTRGEIACYLSHRKAWQYIVENQLDFAVIVEDDVELKANFPEVIQAVSQFPADWDYVKLAEHKRKRRVVYAEKMPRYERVIYNKLPARTCAQAVSLQGAKKLLANTQCFHRPIDVDLQYWWEKQLDVFGLVPYAAVPRSDQVSVIDAQSSRNRAQRSQWQKLRNMWHFFWQNRYHTKHKIAALIAANKR